MGGQGNGTGGGLNAAAAAEAEDEAKRLRAEHQLQQLELRDPVGAEIQKRLTARLSIDSRLAGI